MNAPGPSTTSTVSASGVEAITATLDVERLEQFGNSLEEIYNVDSTVAEILRGHWTRVCLQFPDELLHDSVQVFQAIRIRLPDSVELYIMADTTYGSCCVDEVAAQHVDAQMVVHYGHACLSAPARLSVLYVFPKAPINPQQAVKALQAELQANADALEGRNHLLLLADVAYYWQLDTVADGLEASLGDQFTLIRSSIDTKAYLHPPAKPAATEPATTITSSCCQTGQGSQSCQTEQTACGCDSQARQQPSPPPSNDTHTPSRASCRSYNLPSGISLSRDCAILYLGAESLALNNLLLSKASTPIISYNPKTNIARLESGRTNKMLMRRYGTIQRARDADVFGIVVGTLGVASYLPTLSYLRKLLRKHQKKSYTMAVGKLNPSKLGNFLEVECWILVACGENSIVEAHKEFMKPIVTPWEVEVALGERGWIDVMDEEKGYTLDFQRVLKDSAEKQDVEMKEEVEQVPDDGEGEQIGDDPEGPVFSTVTGKYRYRRTYGTKDDVKDVHDLTEQASALSIRNKESALATVLSSAGGQHLATRTFKGLDPRYGKDAPSVMQAGRSGIAREYGGEVQEP